MTDVVERYSTTIDIYSLRPSGSGSNGATPRLSTAYLCFKIILLLANLLFMIFACILIGLGSYALNSMPNSVAGQTLPAGLVAMGVFILILSALGAMSAWKESVPGLGIYLALLLLITIILFAIAVAITVEKGNAGEYIAEAWYDERAPWDVKNGIQQELGCCGLRYWNDSAAQPCPDVASAPGSAFCYPDLVSGFENAYAHAGGAGIAFSVCMGVGVAMVVALIQGIQKKSHEARAAAAASAAQKHGAAGMLGPDGRPILDPSDPSGGGVGGGEGLVDLSEIDTNAASMFDRAEPSHSQQQQQSLALQGKRRR